MSSIMALRRSPKPGALTEPHSVNVPRSLFTTRVASASPSTSSARITTGADRPHHPLQHPDEVGNRALLELKTRMHGVLENDFHAVGVGDQIGGDITLVELHPFRDVEFGLKCLFVSSTVITPSLPTSSIASGTTPPIDESAARYWQPERSLPSPRLGLASEWADSPRHASNGISIPCLIAPGLPRRPRCASPSGERLGQDGRRSGAVAGDVVGLGGDLPTSWAPMFSKGSSSSISLAMVTPSLTMVGAPNFFSMTTLRPFGPRRHLDGVGERVRPGNRPRRAASSNFRSWPLLTYLGRTSRLEGQQVLAVGGDLGAAVFE